jgi:hypothetical protein
VLPEGHDAESVASEVAVRMLLGECRLALGWTRERLTRELERLVSNEVRRLNGLKEASRMRSEWNILAAGENGRPRSIFPWIAGSIPDPREQAARNEEEAARARTQMELEVYLNGDKRARGLFNCLCNGVFKRRQIAERLGMSVEAVTAARKRLERKVKEFRFKRGLARRVWK